MTSSVNMAVLPRKPKGRPKKVIPEEIRVYLRERAVFIQRSKRWWDLEQGKPIASITNLYEEINTMFPHITDAGQYLWMFHAARYAKMVDDRGYFPGEPTIVTIDGISYINTWTRWRVKEHTEADIEPFLEMTKAMFRGSPQDSAWMLDLIAWHAQNPMEHIPYALVVSGSRLAGDMWAHAFYDAFSPYGVRFGVVHLRSMNRDWVRNASFGLMNGTTNALTNRLSREIMTQLIVSPEARSISDSRKVVTFGRNDVSRMLIMITMPMGREAIVDSPGVYFIVPASDPAPELLDKYHKWLSSDNCGAYLMDWLLKRDVSHFSPPAEAPMTQYAYISRRDNMRPFQRLADDMMQSEDNYVARFISNSLEWAEAVINDPKPSSHRRIHSRQIMEHFPDITVRPWYTVEEIMLMFPDIYMQYTEGMKWGGLSPSFVSKELRIGGLPMLMPSDSPQGFLKGGVYNQYFIIHEKSLWVDPVSQERFDLLMKTWPTYREYVEQQSAKRNDPAT